VDVNLIQNSLNVSLQLRVAGQNQPARVERGDPASTIGMVASFSRTAGAVSLGA
jgi:hypothetical protein